MHLTVGLGSARRQFNSGCAAWRVVSVETDPVDDHPVHILFLFWMTEKNLHLSPLRIV